MSELENLLIKNSNSSLDSLIDSLANWSKKSLTFQNAVETVEKIGKLAERLETEKNYYKTKSEDTIKNFWKIKLTAEQMEGLDMDTLKEYCDGYFAPYFVWNWEGETKASQLVVATCKLVYKYYNDGDRYDKKSVNPMGTFANWIRRHCFKLIWGDDYELKLRHILINAVLNLENYKDQPKIWTIYSY